MTLGDLACFLQRLRHQPAVLVQVEATEGSVPRETGAWMAVFADAVYGSVGGGHLEWQAVQQARAALENPLWQAETRRQALGPSLGQCCGGVVHLSSQKVTHADAAALQAHLDMARAPVAVFGAGHVGAAVVRALAPLPFAVRWIDSRDGVFPAGLPGQVQTEYSDPVQRAVPDLVPGSLVLIMSFSHAEDLALVSACLQRQREQQDLPFIGLIGSRTKWATFSRRLRQRGYTDAELAQVQCPIGLPGITDKQPAVIAASVAAQLLLAMPTWAGDTPSKREHHGNLPA